MTASFWSFNRAVSNDPELLQRLAYYREGLNARRAELSSFAVLSFFKVFEIRASSKRGEKNPTKEWIAAHFSEAMKDVRPEDLTRFVGNRKTENIPNYIFENFRVAAAHTSAQFPSDVDAAPELSRLHLGAEIMQALAVYYIKTTFGFSKSILGD